MSAQRQLFLGCAVGHLFLSGCAARQRDGISSREAARKREEAVRRERERDRLRQDKVRKQIILITLNIDQSDV